MEMENTISQVYEMLKAEADLYRELLLLAQRERDTLLSRDHSALAGISQEKVMLCQRLAQRQHERRQAMARLAPEGRQDPLRLRDFIGQLPPEQRGRFSAVHRQLADMATRLTHLNNESRGFVQEALDTVDHLLGILTGRGKGGSYGRRGQPQQAMGARLMTREV